LTKFFLKYLFVSGLIILLITNIVPLNAGKTKYFKDYKIPKETKAIADVTKNSVPPPENPTQERPKSLLYGTEPSNIHTEIQYDPVTNQYLFVKKVGDDVYEAPYPASFEEYQDYDFNKAMKNYWKQRSKSEIGEHRTSIIPPLKIDNEIFDRIFGGKAIVIQPRGSAEITLGLKYQNTDTPGLSKRERRNTTFTFKEAINMSVVGQIGEKMKVDIKYDTEAAFDFQNSVKLEYTGNEDEIIQKIEAGNVSLPLTGTLINGGQSLFGLKTELKFGKLTVTSIFSQKKSESQTINVEGGAQTKDFEIKADEYETNKHYFLSHYFKENYDKALASLPVISSGIDITRIEVWVTNRSGNFENSRNIIAFSDLGEIKPENIQSEYVANSGLDYNFQCPDNRTNALGFLASDFPQIRDINNAGNTLLGINMTGGTDYEKIESARLLSASEYTINPKLGYISLNSALSNDQVLAVAFEYTLSGKVYKIGEFSNSAINAPQALILKLIKGTSFTPQLTTWSLMMRNIYYMRTYQMSNEDFWLDIMYTNDKTGTNINFLPAGKIKDQRLLTVLNLDNLNEQLDPYSDGMFDYIEGITVNSSNGRIIFPIREPFGNYLRKKITDGDVSLNNIADQFVFQELYDSTQSTARQISEKNKYYLKGRYKSSSGSEISLNAIDVPQGSVKVTAGSQQLQENVHYRVDYNLGKVIILDQGLLASGTPIQISLESNTMFNTITRTLTGTHFNYEFSKDFNIGATVLNLTEKPLTSKINIGEEPMSNTIWGLNASYRKDVPFLTKVIDFLPFLETKEMSTITATGEFAHLIPGHSRAIKKDGNAYIDDFEGSKTTYDIKSYYGWSLASTPADSSMFPESRYMNDLQYGYNRAQFSWYYINSAFYESNKPVSNNQLSSHYVRQLYEKEIFPNRDNPNGNYPAVMNALNLAFYPTERGPYNYDADGISADGFLTNPKKRWGGIMRKVQTPDFEDANIEYIEFWLMDPFVEDENNSGGDLYFNLGDISEDVLKDGRKSFEQGLPTSHNNYPVDTTRWGLIPKIQALVNSFDPGDGDQAEQDVGLDGLGNDKERIFFSTSNGGINDYLDKLAQRFGTSSQAYQNAYNDPSNDDFHYYLGSDFDNAGLGILERYKRFNGMENNSPRNSNESNQNTPNIEDINNDYTLNESENFFQYKVSIRKEDLQVGKNFITDKIEVSSTFENDTKSKVNWYQFKIPISEYEKRVGLIRDFKSIRFIRMYMTNFSDVTYMRFATLNLVRGEWRKYNDSFLQPGEYIITDLPETPFNVGAVNIEENATKTPVNYVLPPGISRETSPMSPQMQQLNEQAMSLTVLNLADGDARAVYKNVNLDMRKYNSLKMFIHAESVPNYPELKDKELSVFVRLGTDYKNNYYEYEIPVSLTPAGHYDGSSELEATDRYLVWPESNNLSIPLELLQNVKQIRNDYLRDGNTNISLTTIYSQQDGERKVSVMGNPNLANVQTIMIGIRNPKKRTQNGPDDGLDKSGEIWVNELRLSDFDEKGGWAANARITAKLADFGTISLAGATSKPGFGAINQKIGELQKEEIYRYDFSANFELGKFFPEKANVRIPLYLAISENFSNPEYNPLDPDIPFKVALTDPKLTKEYKDSMKHIGQDYTKRKSINLNNVKVNKTSGTPKIYDLANWSVSYGYNETMQRDINTVFNTNKTHTGAIFYNYNATPKNVEPLKKVKLFQKKSFQILRDFNFYYLPSQISFRTNINRQYGEMQLRNIYAPEISLPANVRKNFTWVRQYDLTYSLTKNLKLTFSATNNARIDEMEGVMQRRNPLYEQQRDTIWESFKHFGRNTNYTQQWNLTWQIPINKIPILNWINANANYAGTYNWTAAPITKDTTLHLGNTLQNSNTIQLNTNFSLISLYTKIKYLDLINKKYMGQQKAQKKAEKETITYNIPFSIDKGKKKKIRHGLKTEDISISFTKEGEETKNAETPKGNTPSKQPVKPKQPPKDPRVDFKVIDANTIEITATEDIKGENLVVTGSKDKKDNIFRLILDHSLLVLMSVKNVSITFSQNAGTLLPGYLPETRIIGLSKYTPNEQIFGKQPSIFAPTVPFIFGWQEDDFAYWAMSNNVITSDTTSINPFIKTMDRNWQARATIEPIKNLKIDLSANHSLRTNNNSFLLFDGNDYIELNSRTTGSFSMSIISIGTAFETSSKDGDPFSANFERFSKNRLEIAQRFAAERGITATDSLGFPEGYGSLSQNVLIPAFLAAYTNQNPGKIGLDVIPAVLKALPNWRITYDGLSKLAFFKRFFRTFTINHQYRSTYSIGSFQSRLDEEWQTGNGEYNLITDEAGNYYSEFEINGISISEQFAPLIGFDMTMINSLIFKFEIKKSRNLNMSFTNNQLNETKDDDYTIGTGYRFKDVEIIFKLRGQQQKFKSDLNLRLDLSYKDRIQVLRKLEEDISQVTSGTRTFTLKASADYVLNNRFTMRVFYNHLLNKPRISNQPKSTTIDFGITLKFILDS
jgi:cell surface protein SprA